MSEQNIPLSSPSNYAPPPADGPALVPTSLMDMARDIKKPGWWNFYRRWQWRKLQGVVEIHRHNELCSTVATLVQHGMMVNQALVSLSERLKKVEERILMTEAKMNSIIATAHSNMGALKLVDDKN